MIENTTALVLGGGGLTGIAWELGLVAGLADGGVDLRTADLIVGTSAGSAVGAQLRSRVGIDELVAAQHAESKEISPWLDLERLALIWKKLEVGGHTQELLAEVGALALEADTVSEAERLEAVAARLPEAEWPEQPLLITAVDAHSGEFVTFDRLSGVSLLDAVAASCAVPGVWPPVTIGSRRFIDGGVRSGTSCDLAADCARVVVVAPLSEMSRVELEREVAALSDSTEVVVIEADAASNAAFGPNPLDPRRRGAAADAGRTQAATEVERVRAIWSD